MGKENAGALVEMGRDGLSLRTLPKGQSVLKCTRETNKQSIPLPASLMQSVPKRLCRMELSRVLQ